MREMAEEMKRISSRLTNVLIEEFGESKEAYQDVGLGYSVLIHFYMTTLDAMSKDAKAREKLLNDGTELIKKLFVIRDLEKSSEKGLLQ